MKLIDRYLLRTLGAPLAVCLTAFVLVFVVHDLFDHLDNFVSAGTPLDQVLRYYLFLIPSVFYLIVPIALLLAVLYSLSHLTKNNELTAMRASGVSLYRLLVPFAAVGVLFVFIVYGINERIAPDCAYWCDLFISKEKSKDRPDADFSDPIPLKNNRERRVWSVQEIDAKTYAMRGILLIQEREDGSYEVEYNAERGEWLDGQLWFHDVTIQNYDAYSNPRGAEQHVAHLEMTELTESPKDFLNEVKYRKEWMSAIELARFLDTRPDVSPKTFWRYSTDFHYRMAIPWASFVVTLLGIPLGSATGRKGVFFGVFVSIGLFFLYYVAIMFCLALGKQGSIAPWMAGWLPNLGFLGIGCLLLYRMK